MRITTFIVLSYVQLILSNCVPTYLPMDDKLKEELKKSKFIEVLPVEVKQTKDSVEFTTKDTLRALITYHIGRHKSFNDRFVAVSPDIDNVNIETTLQIKPTIINFYRGKRWFRNVNYFTGKGILNQSCPK